MRLVKGVGAGSPVGEEQTKANGFEDASYGTDSDGIERSLLSNELGNNL
jgi:hypothetical protein